MFTFVCLSLVIVSLGYEMNPESCIMETDISFHPIRLVCPFVGKGLYSYDGPLDLQEIRLTRMTVKTFVYLSEQYTVSKFIVDQGDLTMCKNIKADERTIIIVGTKECPSQHNGLRSTVGERKTEVEQTRMPGHSHAHSPSVKPNPPNHPTTHHQQSSVPVVDQADHQQSSPVGTPDLQNDDIPVWIYACVTAVCVAVILVVMIIYCLKTRNCSRIYQETESHIPEEIHFDVFTNQHDHQL